MNLFEKIFLKFTNKELYKIRKEIYRVQKANKKFLNQLLIAEQPNFSIERKQGYSFKHSGNAGDIIYALPTMYALTKESAISLHLHINQPARYSKSIKHPLGDVMLNEKMFSMLQPLLLSQPQIIRCEAYNNQPVDYDLDIFRQYPFPLDTGNIARWYFLTFAVNYDLGKTWLFAQANSDVKDYIIINRSQRYHSPGIDYSFLKKYNRLLFVGLKEEFEDIRLMIPNIEYIAVANFLELAELIAGCKFFIGNQSFPFALAEALKVKRLLEVSFQTPVVSVEGINGFDFCYQPQFEKLVESINQSC